MKHYIKNIELWFKWCLRFI